MQTRAHREVDVARQRGEIARLHGNKFRERAVAIPVGEAEHALPHRQTRRAIAEGGDDSGQLAPGDRWCPYYRRRSAQVEGQSSSVGTNPDA